MKTGRRPYQLAMPRGKYPSKVPPVWWVAFFGGGLGTKIKTFASAWASGEKQS